MAPFDPNAAASPDSGLFGLDTTTEDAKIVLLPVPWDATTSYRPGTHKGPQIILEASHQVDLYDIDTGLEAFTSVTMLNEDPEIRRLNDTARVHAEHVIHQAGRSPTKDTHGHLKKVNELTDRLNQWVYAQAKEILSREQYVAIVGGDHATPLGAIRALSERHKEFGILHVDAHADLRDAYEGFNDSHASIMFNVQKKIPQVSRIVQVGIRDLCAQEKNIIDSSKGRIVTFFDSRLAEQAFSGVTWSESVREIISHLPPKVYISFDIDGLSPELCPNTGTPVPGGLSFQQACYLLRAVSQSRQIIGFDLCEVAPSPDKDSTNETDSIVGARLLYKLCLSLAHSKG